jgi:cold shock CspA family protein
MAPRTPSVGRVVGFDASRGTGVVRGEDGSELTFHSTRITDGSRTADPGAAVVFEVGPGPSPGTWEATSVLKL